MQYSFSHKATQSLMHQSSKCVMKLKLGTIDVTIYKTSTSYFLVYVDVCDSSLIGYKEENSLQQIVLNLCISIGIAF